MPGKSIKDIIKGFIPATLYKWYLSSSFRRSPFRFRNTRSVFTYIYKTNYWRSRESISGAGSELHQTETLRKELVQLFKKFGIKTVLDIPCGDFNWMRFTDLTGIQYTGADIVEKLIEENSKKYGGMKDVRFLTLDLLRDPLPSSDLIMTRDCLVHLSNRDILKALKNIANSGSKYLLTTHFTETAVNKDILTGEWRSINLQKEPFLLPEPLLVINEGCTENNGAFSDKTMSLWDISKLGHLR